MHKSISEEKYSPKIKDILLLLGAGTFLTAAIIMPGLPAVLKPILDAKQRKEKDEWKKFNTWRLRQVLKRMNQQKLIEIDYEKEIPVIKISEKGKQRLLKFDIEEIKLNENHWDGKWRIIVYDIFSKKRQERELFRKTLKRLKFLQLQKSVYLTPFPCQNEIEYLRQICNIGKEVLILTVSGFENDQAYMEYFCLNH